MLWAQRLRLYHATPHAVEHNMLMPATRNIRLTTVADGTLVAEICDYDDHNTPYVFATSDAMFAMTYAVPRGVRLGNCYGCNGTQIVFLDKESLIGIPEFDGKVFGIESSGFIQIHRDGRALDQWVSANAVDLANAESASVKTIDDLLRAGVQVVQIAEGKDFDAIRLHDEWTRSSGSSPDGAAWLLRVAELRDAGHLRWLNQELRINEYSCLPDRRNGGGTASQVPASPLTNGLRP